MSVETLHFLRGNVAARKGALADAPSTEAASNAQNNRAFLPLLA